ncbi:serine/threonine-protein kinase [Streptomyces sp. NPDC007346]|uniref:serine/threonine-protein kinase n=1 Tax=Streptomyces sp. NPDC007346 TaxID=3154682 RepID=UPI003454595E
MRSRGSAAEQAGHGREAVLPGTHPEAGTDRSGRPGVLAAQAHLAGARLASGELIADRYELCRRIGQDGVGTVWEARDTRLDQQVTVERLRSGAVAASETRAQWWERTHRGAQAVARVRHQNVVAVHDVFEAEGRIWVVTEHLDTCSLADLLEERKQLPVPRAAELGLQVARGLRALHGAGVVHRDVTPHNVLVHRGSSVALLGLRATTFTGFGHVPCSAEPPGARGYLAPEPDSPSPGRPEAVTPASDLWALGLTLYEMVEGRPPGTGGAGTVSVPPMENAGPLRTVIEALLEQDPRQRPTAAQAEEMLQAVVTGFPEAEDPPWPAAPDRRTAAAGPAPDATPLLYAGSGVAPMAPAPRGRGRTWQAVVAVVVSIGLLAWGSNWLTTSDWPQRLAELGKRSDGPARYVGLGTYKETHDELVIGVRDDQPGLSLRDKGGEYQGFEVDLAQEIARQMGYEKDEIDFRQVSAENRASLLTSGQADLVIAGYAMTSERKESRAVHFAGPYYEAARGFLVRKGSGIADASDLRDQNAVVCGAGSSTYPAWLRAAGFNVPEDLPRTTEDCLDALLDPEGDVAAVASDDVILAGFQQQHADKVTRLANAQGVESYGVAMSSKEKNLRPEVCSALREITNNGTWEDMYTEHLSTLLGRSEPVSPPSLEECDGAP